MVVVGFSCSASKEALNVIPMSLPFEHGKNAGVTVKIIDDRGIVRLKVIDIIPLEIK